MCLLLIMIIYGCVPLLRNNKSSNFKKYQVIFPSILIHTNKFIF